MRKILVKGYVSDRMYDEYLEDYMYNPYSPFHSLRVQPAKYGKPAKARELTSSENVRYRDELAAQGRKSVLPLETFDDAGRSEALMGQHVYPYHAYSLSPSFDADSRQADLPHSYKVGKKGQRPDLQMYGFEGKDTSPQRIARTGGAHAQTEGIIYGDVPEHQITPIFHKPVSYFDLQAASQALLPTIPTKPSQLNEKQQSIAREMMVMGIPPVLTEEHMFTPDITNAINLDSIKDPTRQWNENQARLNTSLGDLKVASEPMDIAFQLLKERVSPEAKRHKLEYDKKYESSPERVKYREDLNRERRRRGIYGSHNHQDVSHTEGGKLTLEGEHENRARHFKDKGTLREL